MDMDKAFIATTLKAMAARLKEQAESLEYIAETIDDQPTHAISGTLNNLLWLLPNLGIQEIIRHLLMRAPKKD